MSPSSRATHLRQYLTWKIKKDKKNRYFVLLLQNFPEKYVTQHFVLLPDKANQSCCFNSSASRIKETPETNTDKEFVILKDFIRDQLVSCQIFSGLTIFLWINNQIRMNEEEHNPRLIFVCLFWKIYISKFKITVYSCTSEYNTIPMLAMWAKVIILDWGKHSYYRLGWDKSNNRTVYQDCSWGVLPSRSSIIQITLKRRRKNPDILHPFPDDTVVIKSLIKYLLELYCRLW